MLKTAILRQAAHAERTPLIKFIGKRTTPAPSQLDHAVHPHPASPTGTLPAGFGTGSSSSSSASNSHNSFSSYRDHAQQFGPLRKTIAAHPSQGVIGSKTGSELGAVAPPKGIAFDRVELPKRFARMPISMAEMEAIESGGAAVL